MSAPAAVGGNRLEWKDLPGELRELIEKRLGSEVTAAHSQVGGFSPGLASRLRLGDGRRAFAKAVSATRNPDSPAAHRREARVLAALPAAVGAPKLIWSGDLDEWVVLITEDVDGRNPAQPWVAAEFDEAVGALARLAERLTPNPTDITDHVINNLAADFNGWRALAHDGARLPSEFEWAQRNLERLSNLEQSWTAAAADGMTLMHGDARADNMLLTARGVILVDWPHAVMGPAWMDLLFMLPSAIMQGLADPESVWRRYSPALGVHPDAVNAVLAAVAGFFVAASLRPAPLNLPTLRAFQAAQGRAALAWLRERIA
jgi:aminoglycoside phosphotransferase (APT) family kinase protein